MESPRISPRAPKISRHGSSRAAPRNASRLKRAGDSPRKCASDNVPVLRRVRKDEAVKMLDLFCGRWGWSRAFAARGWECVGVDLTEPPEIPQNCHFFKRDVLDLDVDICLGQLPYSEGWIYDHISMFDFICASSPCEQFSVHGMKHFHPNPPHPELGIQLFEHTRALCEASGVPYVMENVRAAQQFVGQAKHHCGPFYLWGTGVP